MIFTFSKNEKQNNFFITNISIKNMKLNIPLATFKETFRFYFGRINGVD